MMDGDGHHGGGGDDGFVRRNDVEKLKEMQLSIAASSSVFPGFRFSPTDDELISYYLKKKLQGNDSCVDIIPEVDFCRHEPWDLPALSIIQSENEWDGSDEGNPMKSSCSKDSISSYLSHSVEQTESESDSDRQLILHESTHGSSSPYKDHQSVS
nr:NAC domain-containing protein 89-like [Tanacetum cinerariifolium]